ncbi:MAG: hypothetical protein JNN25_12020 [Candidatus Kapabacteria bacterium]|nr:hypothetical protein [Candidatus Kapabacteria bacterium]
MLNNFPNYLNPTVTFSPINVMWNHNRWLLFGSYFTGGASVGRDTSISRVLHEVTLGFGYVAINTPRFRLYPMVGATGTIDLITITQPTTFNALLAGSNPYSFTVQRGGGVLEVAIGADYSVPLEYGDIYVMTKIGYNFEAGANWAYGGQSLPDTDSNWFSRRGIFFQIGVGFGTGRQ